MFKHVTTFTDFLLHEQSTIDKPEGFITLLTLIENCAKIISSHVSKSGLVDIMGTADKKNISNDEVQKLDIFTNELFVQTLLESGHVYAIGSEEEEDIRISKKEHQGSYNVFFDPLDGSSNIDTSLPIGTIFSIYKKGASLLQKGEEQIAAGYILYSTSTMLVLTLGKGVTGFTLDPSIGSFLLSHSHMRIPEKGNIYSVNEGYEQFFNNNTKAFLTHLKASGTYKGRYVGSLVADLHRTLLKGGIFLYPEDLKQPEGKLRLMYEVNPFSFIITQAGGKAVSKNGNPLAIPPQAVYQRAPLVIGSKENIEEYMMFMK